MVAQLTRASSHLSHGLLVVLAVVLSIGEVAGDDAKKLTPRYAAKDLYEVEAKLVFEAQVALAVPGHGISRVTTEVLANGHKYRDEVLEASKGGTPVKVRRKYLEAWEAEQEPGMRAPVRRAGPLDRRTITLALDEKGHQKITVPEGSPPLAEEAVAGELIREKWDLALPQEPVAPGATWKVKDERLGALFPVLGQKPDGELEARFDSIKDLSLEKGAPKEPVAIVKVKVKTRREETGTEEDGTASKSSFEVELQGELRFALDRSKLILVHLKGEGRVDQERKDTTGAVMTIAKRGPFEITKRIRFPATDEKERK